MHRAITSRSAGLASARLWLLAAAWFVLLAGPTAIAFFAGGYFDEARDWAGLLAWLLVAFAIGARVASWPRSAAGWCAIGGISALAAWTLASVAWAPTAGGAYHSAQVVVLYAGMLIAATLLLAPPSIWSWVEPALALGTLIVVGYGLSERMVPALLHFSRSISAQGRLEQPLTYWNAMGELAALGFVLCARMAGARERPRLIGAAAAAGCAPLGLGLYLSFSRGALFGCAAGLVALLVAAPTRAQLRGVILAVLGGGIAAAAGAPFRAVTGLSGGLALREKQGAIVLAILLVVMSAGALGHARWVRRESGRKLRLPAHASWIALSLICAGLALAMVVGAKESTTAPLGNGASRLVSLESNRYAYWRVALKAFDTEPLHGVGAGGWSVWWLRDRTVNEFAQDAHSLPLQTAAELGLVGLIALATLVYGVVMAARRAHRVSPGVVAGPIAALVVYAAHAPLDWDWQMPAVTLVAVVLAGFVLALGSVRAPDRRVAGALP